MVVSERLARSENGPAGRSVEARDALAAPQRHVVLFEESLGAKAQIIHARLALEISLGQRRPLVGKVRLIADERHASR